MVIFSSKKSPWRPSWISNFRQIPSQTSSHLYQPHAIILYEVTYKVSSWQLERTGCTSFIYTAYYVFILFFYLQVFIRTSVGTCRMIFNQKKIFVKIGDTRFHQDTVDKWHEHLELLSKRICTQKMSFFSTGAIIIQ